MRDENKDFILDCSVSISWCFPDESSEYNTRVMDFLSSFPEAKAVVPDLWRFETTNSLLKAIKRNRIIQSDVNNYLSILDDLNIDVVIVDITVRELLLLSEKYKLTSYDCMYLILSMQHNLPVATNDKALEKAVLDSGGKLYLK